MYEVSECAPQEALRNLDHAFDNFFRRAKTQEKRHTSRQGGFPTCKSKKRGLGGFRLTGSIRRLPRCCSVAAPGEVAPERARLPADNGVKVLSATV